MQGKSLYCYFLFMVINIVFTRVEPSTLHCRVEGGTDHLQSTEHTLDTRTQNIQLGKLDI